MLNNTKVGSQAGARPAAAIEIAPEGVLAAVHSGARKRIADPEAGCLYAYAALPQDAIVPSLEEPNLRQPEAVASAIRKALDELAPRKRAVTMVLPDTLVRVFVLDFDSLPAKPAEAVSVVRFRLRKMVPFEVEHAAVSYQLLEQSVSECKVLAAVMPGPILAEYESVVRAAGYEPGVVLPSSLAAMETLDPMEATLTANLGAQTVTTSIATGSNLLLYRTIDLPEDAAERTAEIQRAIAVATAYFEDKLGARPRSIYYAGVRNVGEFATIVADPELTVIDWAPRPEAGALTALPQTNFAGVTGALAGAN